MASPTTFATCRFGRFVIDPAERRLLADGQPVVLGGRAFDLLAALVARAGSLVSKHELLEQVWPGLVVEENNLQVQVSSLRKLLGPGALTTIPGRGYRFEMPVEVDAGAAQEANAARQRPPPSTDAVALPAPAGAERTRRVHTNLPSHPPVLFGRAPDLAAIAALLARHSLVTIVGAGGIGKTRMAQAVAARAVSEGADRFPDGVWWIDLAPLSDDALVAAAVARVLETVVTGERPHLETLAAVLEPMRVLLVLDNCEHLTDAVAQFVVQSCAPASGVRVLVTSQETLKVADEHVYRLGALPLPVADADGAALQSGAVELFAARAQAVDPRFALGPANVAAVAEICRRLDGIPLAIELAAARVPLLGVEGLRARLDERFNVLTARARVVLRRHQTLRATLEWSHGLLTAEEQRVFRRLGVFGGSFALEAAQRVVQDADLDGWAALDHLGALVDRSLVLAEGDPVPRYRLLETTRAYALERLGDAGETGAMLRRHAEALLERLAAIEADVVRSGHRRVGFVAAALEVDNLRAALNFAAGAEDCRQLTIELAAHSFRVWTATFQLHEGLERCLGVARLVGDDVPPALAARFWLTVASVGLYATNRAVHDAALRAVALYRTLDDPIHLYEALVHSAVTGSRFGTPDEMGACIAAAESLVQPGWPSLRRARLEFARTRWLARLGRYEEMLAAACRQSAICAEDGNELGRLYAVSNIVAAENLLGRCELAQAHAREAIERLDLLGAGAGAGHLWLGVLTAEVLRGHPEAALAAGRTAYALLLREGDELRTFWGLALCAVQRNAPADGARIVGYAEAALRRAGVQFSGQAGSTREALTASLRAAFSADELECLRAEGAAMREEVVVKLALGTAEGRGGGA